MEKLDGRLVADRLFEWRDRAGWSQAETAERAGMSTTGLNSLENIKIAHPRIGSLRKLSRAFGVSPEKFLAGPDQEAADPLEDAPERLREPLRNLSPAEFRRLLIGSRDAENWLPGNSEDTVGALQEARGFMFRHGISREELHQTLLEISPFSARNLLLEQEHADRQAEEDAAGIYEEVLQGAVATGGMGIREAGDRLTRFSQGAA